MTRYAMLIEAEKCVGCMACVSACAEQWDTGPGAARDWVHTFEHGTRGQDLGITFYPGLCMHCAQHPCTADCPVGATWMNDRGVVVVDPRLCIGCGNCVSTCAYGARHFDPRKGIIEKCNLCEPFVVQGRLPACVSTCLAECRHFGDLDDPDGDLVQRIRASGARPLSTPEVDIGPKVHYTDAASRAAILAAGSLRAPAQSWLTRIWQGWSRPFSRFVVPGVVLSAGLGGLALNFLAARRTRGGPPPEDAPDPDGEAPAPQTPAAELHRHRLGMRLLHWFNAASWILLLFTGTALLSARSFALFGQGLPAFGARLFGDAAGLLHTHAVWGMIWAAVIVPFFLLFKRGGREALEEVRLTGDDLRWLLVKPWAMLGLARQPLPPQDKYNAGQKVFAITALLGTTTIIATGLVMTFHLGPPWLVAAALLVHKLAIAFALMGLAVHITMAAILRAERPALKAMFTGRVDRAHAERHSAKWVAHLESRTPESDREKRP